MEALNSAPPRPVRVTGPFTFTMTGCEGMGSHTLGGIVHQVRCAHTDIAIALDAMAIGSA